MAPKRAASQEDANDERDRQVYGKRRYGPSELQDTRYLQFLAASSSNSTNDMELSLERAIRKVAQDVIPPILEEALQRFLSPCRGLSLSRQISTPGGGRVLQLCFMNGPPSSIFTLSNITAADGSPLQIALCDVAFQHRKVKEDCPSMKIKICVLDGDFGSNGSEDWAAEEFNANILSQREGKPPLLSRDTVVTLKNGVGYVKNVVFTDNSRWTRSGMFRIGVKVWQSTFIAADIKEGRTEPLRVKDNRGEGYKKHDRPSLNDKVWRLQRIAKNGTIHKQLSLHRIETVKDLLQLYTTDQASLRQKIGNIPGKSWEKIIEHAKKACEIDNEERYTYQYLAAEQSIFLLLNCIYQVLGVSFNGQNFCTVESLNSEEERLVEMVKRQAYNNLDDLKPIEPTPHSMVGTLAALQRGAPDQGLQQFYLPNAQQGQPSTSTTSYIDEAAQSDQVVSSQLRDQLVGMPLDWSAGEQLLSGAYNGWTDSGSLIDQLASYLVPPTPLGPVDPFCLPCDYGAESSNPFPNSVVYIPSKGKRKTVWNKIRNALKWVLMHAAKRKAKVFHYQY